MPSFFSGLLLDILQSLSIVFSLVFAGITLRRNSKSRRASNLISLNNSHRDLWLNISGSPDGVRILNEQVDLVQKPISTKEHQLVVMAILHLSTTFQVFRLGVMTEVEGMKKDVKSFFELPIPKEVWKSNKVFQNRKFVDFIDKILSD